MVPLRVRYAVSKRLDIDRFVRLRRMGECQLFFCLADLPIYQHPLHARSQVSALLLLQVGPGCLT